MILRNLLESPAKAVPIAMMFTTVGLMLIALGEVWPKIAFLAALAWPVSNDFLRGFVLGFAIVLEIAGVALAAAARRKQL